MPVMIYDEDAFEKMVEVEGEDYRRFRDKIRFGICSFEAFLETWKKLDSENTEFKNDRPGFSIGVDRNGAIYGAGGWHRYIVRNDGEILFLRAAARGWPCDYHKEYVEKARAAGFRIFSEDLNNN